MRLLQRTASEPEPTYEDFLVEVVAEREKKQAAEDAIEARARLSTWQFAQGQRRADEERREKRKVEAAKFGAEILAAQQRLYGALAARIDPATSYRVIVLQVSRETARDGHLYVIASTEAKEGAARDLIRSLGLTCEMVRPADRRGDQLPKAIPAGALVAVDPERGDSGLADLATRERAIRDDRQQREAAASARAREEQRREEERQRFGVALS